MLRKVFLTFPENLIQDPVLYELAKTFNVRTNIRGASVTQQLALVALEIDGEEPDVAAAIGHLEQMDVQVELLGDA